MISKRTVHPACSVVQLQPAEMSISIDFIDFAISHHFSSEGVYLVKNLEVHPIGVTCSLERSS